MSRVGVAVEDDLLGVERARPDVAVDDAEGSQREHDAASVRDDVALGIGAAAGDVHSARGGLRLGHMPVPQLVRGLVDGGRLGRRWGANRAPRWRRPRRWVISAAPAAGLPGAGSLTDVPGSCLPDGPRPLGLPDPGESSSSGCPHHLIRLTTNRRSFATGWSAGSRPRSPYGEAVTSAGGFTTTD